MGFKDGLVTFTEYCGSLVVSTDSKALMETLLEKNEKHLFFLGRFAMQHFIFKASSTKCSLLVMTFVLFTAFQLIPSFF